MFGSVIKNKIENNFQYLTMSWKINWKITFNVLIFFKFIKIIEIKSDR
jgi:hypothetical protein